MDQINISNNEKLPLFPETLESLNYNIVNLILKDKRDHIPPDIIDYIKSLPDFTINNIYHVELNKKLQRSAKIKQLKKIENLYCDYFIPPPM